jgi:uncharacterized protein (TIGR02611 family)
MERLKHHWSRIPSTIRKPLVLVIGSLFIIAAGLTGWLPGPGGIPLFLIGIAILSTEFEWAQRLRDWALDKLRVVGQWWRQHKIVGTLTFAACGAIFLTLGFFAYRTFKDLF